MCVLGHPGGLDMRSTAAELSGKLFVLMLIVSVFVWCNVRLSYPLSLCGVWRSSVSVRMPVRSEQTPAGAHPPVSVWEQQRQRQHRQHSEHTHQQHGIRVPRPSLYLTALQSVKHRREEVIRPPEKTQEPWIPATGKTKHKPSGTKRKFVAFLQSRRQNKRQTAAGLRDACVRSQTLKGTFTWSMAHDLQYTHVSLAVLTVKTVSFLWDVLGKGYLWVNLRKH